MQRVVVPMVGLLALAACGPSALEVKTAADAQAATQAATQAVAEAANAKAAADEQAAKVKAAADEQASKIKALAAIEAAALRAEADKLEAAIPAARQAAEAAQARALGAASGLAKLEEDLGGCQTRAEAAAERAAAARLAKVTQLEAAGEACNQQAARERPNCEDNCSFAAGRCRSHWLQCRGSESDCKERCGTSAELGCQRAWAQVTTAKGAGPDGNNPCEALEAKTAKAREPAEAAVAASARVTSLVQGVAAARTKADNLVAEARTKADNLVVGVAHCGAVGRAAILAGTFTMEAGQVTVAAYCMDRTEVTTAAYATCVESGKCTAATTSGSCNAGVAARGDHPINCVNWNQATAYCEAQGQRLPTEEEWEYAARGTDGRVYPWGNAEPAGQLCWTGEGNSLGKGKRQSTCAVASFPTGNSPFGLSDMSGDVWEWTSSAYSATDAGRVVRGGSWGYGVPSFVRSASRSGGDPSGQGDGLGFRCAGSFFP